MRTSARTTLRTGVTAALLPLCLALPTFGGTAAAAGVPDRVGIVGPAGTVSPSLQAVNVSVHEGNRPVAGAKVRLQRKTSRGWVAAGTLVTGPRGYGRGAIRFNSSMILRAVSPDGVSREMLVRVGRQAAARPATARLGMAATAKAPAGGFRAAALRVALAQRGKPYRWGSTGPSSFDCSGLVNYAFRAVGKSVPRTSSQLRRWTKPVSRAAAVPGDLVFSPGHVGIYVSPGVMVDAPNSGGRVSVRKIYARNYTIGRVV